MTTDYIVTGMTCDHCANTVRTHVGKLPGVSEVAVDLGSGRVSVTSEAPLDAGAVREAVTAAGYRLER